MYVRYMHVCGRGVRINPIIVYLVGLAFSLEVGESLVSEVSCFMLCLELVPTVLTLASLLWS